MPTVEGFLQDLTLLVFWKINLTVCLVSKGVDRVNEVGQRMCFSFLRPGSEGRSNFHVYKEKERDRVTPGGVSDFIPS